MLISHSLKHCNLLPVVLVELTFVLFKESARFDKELLEYHVQVQAEENGEEDAHELRLEFIQTLINEVL